MTRLALPISARLAVWYALTLLLLLSAFALFCYTGFHVALHRDFDAHLTHEQRSLMPFVEVEPTGPSLRGLTGQEPVAYRTNGIFGTYVRLFDARGGLRYRTPNFAGHAAFPVTLPSMPRVTAESRTWEGAPTRTRYVPLERGGRLVGWLEVTGFEWSLHRELHRLGRTLAVGVLLSVALALAGGWWLARRALRPVAVLTAAAARMSARGADPSARLPADFEPRDELTALAETFNGLLARLEGSVARERRFTANAAHELMTPLATLRSEAEVALRRERTPAAYREVLARIVDETAWMTATVRSLLQLARAETLGPSPTDRLDLGALVAARAERLRASAEGRGVALEVAVVPDVEVAAQAEPVAEVVDNLVGNALKYTPRGGRVRVEVSRAGGTARVRVADTGIGFDPADADRLFDRFYRSDAPEVQAEPGSGLGLPIAKAVAEAYGGTVRAESAGVGRGAAFEVALPILQAGAARGGKHQMR